MLSLHFAQEPLVPADIEAHEIAAVSGGRKLVFENVSALAVDRDGFAFGADGIQRRVPLLHLRDIGAYVLGAVVFVRDMRGYK